MENYFVDPFGPFHIKIVATIAYIHMLPGCCIALCFIWYEVSGNAGPYRTCINQLVSGIYFMVGIVFNCNIKSHFLLFKKVSESLQKHLNSRSCTNVGVQRLASESSSGARM